MPEATQAMVPSPIAYAPTEEGGPSAAALLGATEVLSAGDAAPTTQVDSSALDSLFGEQNFRDYASEPPVVAAPKAPREALVDPGHISSSTTVLTPASARETASQRR